MIRSFCGSCESLFVAVEDGSEIFISKYFFGFGLSISEGMSVAFVNVVDIRRYCHVNDTRAKRTLHEQAGTRYQK